MEVGCNSPINNPFRCELNSGDNKAATPLPATRCWYVQIYFSINSNLMAFATAPFEFVYGG